MRVASTKSEEVGPPMVAHSPFGISLIKGVDSIRLSVCILGDESNPDI